MGTVSLVLDAIRRGGPLTVAQYIDIALYHDTHGYYASAGRRSGRAGDFYTSVDVGPLFGELLARQFAEMWEILAAGDERSAAGDERRAARDEPPAASPSFDLVEAAAGDGQLARDVLDAAAADPAFHQAIRLHLVERSQRARALQPATLGPHAPCLASSGTELPPAIEGVVFANELLDALPVHQVVMREEGLREVYVTARGDTLIEMEGSLSNPAVGSWLELAGARLRPGWRAEAALAADAWIRQAARALKRGFLLLVDYGHEAARLYDASHATGTLASYRRHAIDPAGGAAGVPAAPAWLQDPGGRDITSHVNLTAVRRAAEEEGLQTIGVLDQTYFLLGLGIADRMAEAAGPSVPSLRRRLAAKTLLLPGGLGSTQKVLIFGRGVGVPALRGCSYRLRAT